MAISVFLLQCRHACMWVVSLHIYTDRCGHCREWGRREKGRGESQWRLDVALKIDEDSTMATVLGCSPKIKSREKHWLFRLHLPSLAHSPPPTLIHLSLFHTHIYHSFLRCVKNTLKRHSVGIWWALVPGLCQPPHPHWPWKCYSPNSFFHFHFPFPLAQILVFHQQILLPT